VLTEILIISGYKFIFRPFATRVYICGPQQTEVTRHISLALWVHFVIGEGFIFMAAYFQTVVRQHSLVRFGRIVWE
jgi:hypothetical protein